MKSLTILTIPALTILAACATSSADVDPLIAPIVDKTLTNSENGMTVVLGSDGSVKGGNGDVTIEGAYEMRDGKYCRTLTLPESFAGTECQNVTITEDSVEFESPSGRRSTWTF